MSLYTQVVWVYNKTAVASNIAINTGIDFMNAYLKYKLSLVMLAQCR